VFERSIIYLLEAIIKSGEEYKCEIVALELSRLYMSSEICTRALVFCVSHFRPELAKYFIIFTHLCEIQKLKYQELIKHDKEAVVTLKKVA